MVDKYVYFGFQCQAVGFEYTEYDVMIFTKKITKGKT